MSSRCCVFYEKGRVEGGFELGIRRALERLLVSPEFLFRMEFDPPNRAGEHFVSDHGSAARLPVVVLFLEQHSRTTSCSIWPAAVS